MLEAVRKLYFPDAADETAAVKVLSRLRRGRFLNARDLYPRRKYWTLTAAAARARGLNPKIARPLGYDALARAFGALAFCCLGEAPRSRFTPHEFRERFPSLYKPGPGASWYYVDEDDEGRKRLGLILVDKGGGYRRIARKCLDRTRQRLEIPAFRDVIVQDGFTIAVVTAWEEKKRFIEQALSDYDLYATVRIEVHPELAQLLGGRRRRETERRHES